ncbi:MAG: carbohydrate porin [Bradyrhizobium sp.]|nr:carbohydrate porin [Bradyrhizobium sp.]
MVASDVATNRGPMAAMILAVLIALCTLAAPWPAHAVGDLANYLSKITPSEFFPGADRFGAPQGEPPIVPVYRGDQLQGHVYLNSDFANAVGYSGKPINILVGIAPKGVITGLKLVDHKEPIVLIGIPEPRIIAALNGLLGKDMTPIAQGAEHAPQADIISGATVTVLVMHDSIVRAAMRLIRSGRIGGSNPAGAVTTPPSVVKTVDPDKSEIRDWTSLLGDGSVRRLHLSIGDVNDAFAKSGNTVAAQNPEPGNSDDTFIDLYVALASVPSIGRSLLGEEGYQRLKDRLQPGQQAILVAGDGVYSFKGSAYVRGGIFDLSIAPNTTSLDSRFGQFQWIGEIERRYSILGQPGKIAVTGFLTRGGMGSFNDAIQLAAVTGAPADITAVRHYQSRGGISMNLEQQINENVGFFARAGWADGHKEAYEFTDIDRSVAAGFSISGRVWGRNDDVWGIAGVDNGITNVHQAFLNAGGLGILVGDGQLPHAGDERILETYYSFPWFASRITLDYQLIVNPAYNRDRGPASLLGVRLHTQY